jgi:hypothetical protein
VGRRRPDPMPDAREVDRQQAGELGIGEADQRLRRPESGVVHEDREPAEGRGRLLDGRRQLLGVGDIGAEREVALIELGGQLAAGSLVDVNDGHPGPIAGQTARHRAPDAMGTTGDHGRMPVERSGHCAAPKP